MPVQKGYPQKSYPPRGYPNPYANPYSHPFQNAARRPVPKKRFNPFYALKRLVYWLLIAFVVVGVMGTILSFLLARSISATHGLSHLFNLPEINLPVLGGGPAKLVSNQPVLAATPQPWNGKTRVTILVMGLDYRDWQANNVPHSDSMWLFTIDPATKTAGMMSIPRDLYVPIPGYGTSKINMAYFYGDAYKLPGGGSALAAKTVEQLLNIKIDYTAVIDFNSFVKLIDKLDGIWIDVPEEITVDPLGPGNTVTLKPGRQRLMGAVALAYARMRYTNDGDFDRMRRQEQVILAIRSRVMDPKYLPILIGNASGVYNLIASGVHTTLGLQQAIQLAWLAKDIPLNQIQKGVIDHSMVTDSYSPEGWEILVPDMQKIDALRDQIFPAHPVAAAPAGQASSQPTVSQADQLKAESATVAVQNGTEVSGLAARTSDYLTSLGLKTAAPADAGSSYDTTAIIDYSGKSATAAYLAGVMHVSQSQVFNRSDPHPPADIVVIIGADWANSNPMP